MHGRALVAAGLLAAACSPVTPPGLVLDVGRVCQDIALEVADPDVLPGSTIHAAAIPRSGDDAAWYLASRASGVELRRVPEDIPGLDLSAIGVPAEFHLQRGSLEGQVWLALDRDGETRLWRIDDDSAVIDESPLIVDFPTDGSPAIRRLVFLGHTPHLVAFPRASTVGELPVEVAAITPSLTLGERWALTATIVCAPLSETSCPLYWDDLRDVTVLDTAEPGSIAGAAILLAVASQEDQVPINPEMPPPFETHIISVALQHDAAAERPVLTRRDHTSWATSGPVRPWPAQIAADPLGLYVLAGLVPGPDTSGADATSADYLFRTELLGDGSSNASGVIALLPTAYRSHLLQLGGRVAIGQRPDTTWYVAPIEGVMIDEEIVGSLKIGEPARLLLAGRGQVVVVGDGAPSRRVQIACADPDPDPNPEGPDPLPEGI